MTRPSTPIIRSTVLLRLGRASRLTRTSGPGIIPEPMNPIERYV